MNCSNCKKDLVAGFECSSPACVALRTPAVEVPVAEEESPVAKLKTAIKRASKKK